LAYWLLSTELTSLLDIYLDLFVTGGFLPHRQNKHLHMASPAQQMLWFLFRISFFIFLPVVVSADVQLCLPVAVAGALTGDY
jgi:hypothetical protein